MTQPEVKQPDTWCVMPFSHINIKHGGKLSACWRYPDRIGDYTKDTLREAFNSEKMQELRRALLNGEKHIGCRSCWDLESAGIASTRTSCIKSYSDTVNYNTAMQSLNFEDYTVPVEKITSIEIRFDNICNLMCRHCSPDYSSKWENAVKKDEALMKQMSQHGTYRNTENHVNLTDELIEEIRTLAPHLKQILIAGGEPLYHHKHYTFLENLQDHASNIELSYSSNFNTLEYKGKSILDLWKKFKKVDIRVSIDADPSIYEYVRVHSDLPKVESNIKTALMELDNLRLSATCTTSMLNITRMTDIFEYFNSLGVYVHTSLVQYPEALNLRLLPTELKNKVTNNWKLWFDNVEYNLKKNSRLVNNFQLDMGVQISRIKNCGDSIIDYMNSADCYEKHWDDFKNYITILDNHHKTNVLDWYPEFKKYW